MKIQLASDLHFEFYERDNYEEVASRLVEQTDADVMVLAGDIANVVNGSVREYLQVFCDRYQDVIYVPGNHDWWSKTMPAKESHFQALTDIPNLHVLSHATKYHTTINGQRFVGDTLWVPDTPGARMTRTNDVKFIQSLMPWAFERHEEFKNWLRINLLETDILVTHYLPSWQSVAPKYRGAPTNAWFVGDIDGIIAGVQPKMVLHGHTHSSTTYLLGETRVVCNPAGYPGEPFQGYDRAMVLEV